MGTTKTEFKMPGGKIVQVTSADRSSHDMGGSEALTGRRMGGGVNDLSHSLTESGKAAK